MRAIRRFRLLDAMILVAATGIGLGVVVGLQHVTYGQLSFSEIGDAWSDLLDALRSVEGAVLVGAAAQLTVLTASMLLPVAAIWTLALLPIGLMSPRPALRRLAREPGFVAVCAASLTIAGIGLTALALWVAVEFGINGLADAVVDFVPMLPAIMGWSVVIAWGTLLLGGRWRVQRTWIDRLGRASGIFWVLGGLTVTVALLLSTFNFKCTWPYTDVITNAAAPTPSPTGSLPLEPPAGGADRP